MPILDKDQPFTPIKAYMAYHDDRGVTFRWDAESEQIEAHVHQLTPEHRMELVPITGSVYDSDSAIGWLQFFQHICQQHIRMREAAGEEIVRGPNTEARQ